MTIQHSAITGANVHESKGVDTAAAKLVYVTDGAGSGTWKKVGTDNLLGLTGDSDLVGRKLLTDGNEGFTLGLDSAYGSMTITNNSNTFAVLDSTDNTLASTTGYSILTGTGAPWVSANLYGITFSTNKLTVPVTGLYELTAFLYIAQTPTAGNKVAARYVVNGSTYGARRYSAKVAVDGDNFQLDMHELVQLTAGDYIQIAYASSINHNAIINDAAVNLKLIRQTA